ncbi:MAG TPA: peptide chain release factor N(5)-glutamine methyltransferase [Dermatophilaceae bacterium]|nr:peptide chain release factor N(5)-glutamine methyltransferase [Dermatophilaceae bacterium]
MRLAAAVRAATARLAAVGVGSPEADAVALAGHLLGVGPGQVRRLSALGADAPPGYAELVAERAGRVPLQHLTGRAYFRRLTLSVGPGVFLPRPETELLAGFGATWAAALAAPVVVDLCTGSGAVALSVADEVPAAQVYGVELAEQAYAWAVRNRDLLGLPVTLVQADATQPVLTDLAGVVDVVLANPPYVPPGMEPLDPEVRDHDPAEALFGGGADGLGIPLRVARTAAGLLRAGGWFAMEHADVQGDAVVTALARAGCWADVHDHVDLNGRPRCVTARRA